METSECNCWREIMHDLNCIQISRKSCSTRTNQQPLLLADFYLFVFKNSPAWCCWAKALPALNNPSLCILDMWNCEKRSVTQQLRFVVLITDWLFCSIHADTLMADYIPAGFMLAGISLTSSHLGEAAGGRPPAVRPSCRWSCRPPRCGPHRADLQTETTAGENV